MQSYGNAVDSYPSPDVDLAGYLAALDKDSISRANEVPQIWSPIELKNRNWIDSKAAARKYGKEGGKCVIA